MINFKSFLTPTFALCFAFALSILSLFVPSDYYASRFSEESRITYNITVLAWVIMCCATYCAGIIFANKILSPSRKNNRAFLAFEAKRSRYIVLLLTLLCVFLNLFGVMQLIKTFGVVGFAKSLIGVSDTDLRLSVYYALKSVNTGWAIAFTAPVFCLSYVYYRLFPRDNIKILLVFLVTTHTLLILATQSKGPIFTLILSAMLCELLLRYPNITFNKKDLFKYTSVLVFLVCVFVVIQSRRNPNIATLDGLVREIIAYTLVSYNRLAYLMDDKLHIPNMFVGFYTNRWYWGLPGEDYSNYLLKLLGFDIPSNAFDSWLDTFSSVGASGLNAKYIWVTIFGEAYADYGRYGFIWFFFYGILSQLAYSSITRGKFEGFAIYPLLVQWNLSWYGGATVGTRSMLFCALIMIVLQLRYIRMRNQFDGRLNENSYHRSALK